LHLGGIYPGEVIGETKAPSVTDELLAAYAADHRACAPGPDAIIRLAKLKVGPYLRALRTFDGRDRGADRGILRVELLCLAIQRQGLAPPPGLLIDSREPAHRFRALRHRHDQLAEVMARVGNLSGPGRELGAQQPETQRGGLVAV
jgi:hypothetical protein